MWKSKDIEEYFNVTRQTVKLWRDLGMPNERNGGQFSYKKEEVVVWVHAYRSKNYSTGQFESAVAEAVEIIIQKRMANFKEEFLKRLAEIIETMGG